MTSLTAALRNAAPVAAIAGMLTVALTACTTTTYTPRQVPVPQVLPSGKQEARILDGRIAADLDSIDALQARIEKLNAGGIPVDDYDLARAQCWLSFGLEEYHQNDRTGVIEAALTESQSIVQALETGTPPAATRSPIATAVKIRPDLWDRLAALQAAPGRRCGAVQAACLEVVLNHAGHDYNETGWRHARDKISAAERLAAEGATRIAGCPAEPAAVAAATVPAADAPADADRDGVPDARDLCPDTPPPAVVDAHGCTERYEISLPGVVFATDESRLLPESFPVLDGAAATLMRHPDLSIEIAGHTDSRAPDAHNLALSQRRAETVRRYLIERGVKNPLIARGYGETAPVADNASDAGMATNRRVVLRILR
jgi:outer membrane protein OmpA-like peptidoglycan-associated protein